MPSDNCHCWGGAAETLEDAAADFGLSELAGRTGDRAAQPGAPATTTSAVVPDLLPSRVLHPPPAGPGHPDNVVGLVDRPEGQGALPPATTGGDTHVFAVATA